MDAIFQHLLTADPAVTPSEDLHAWWDRHRDLAMDRTFPVDHALAAGFAMDRVGWAFATGYQCALARLFPGLPPGRPAALAVTEAAGGHPRAIATLLAGPPGARTLSGHKRFITLGFYAEVLFVVATTGTDDAGRPRLVVAMMEAWAPGITLTAGPETPFAPEVPHGAADFRGVSVPDNAVLPGDGYADYVKPFRTVEDAHVTAAVGAYLLRLAREHRWPRESVADLVAVLAGVRAAALADPRSPAVHIALDGLLRALRVWIASAAVHLDALPEPARSRWVRDQGLLVVADRVRAARTEAAWTALE